MLLADKNAVIYGAAGAIGATVARAFAAEGATVFVTGRNAASLDTVAKEISASGGTAHTAVVDATDEDAVEKHAGMVAAQAGSLDIRPDLSRCSAGDRRRPDGVRRPGRAGVGWAGGRAKVRSRPG
jgi:NAD(P)-dependent dehydrogenase (short-subunit alcohol dehydrogenase family)